MTEPFIGQIQPFGFGFAPRHWAQCNGQILSIAQNTALFSLLGTIYGGNGQTTFALPDLQSRVPMHQGSNLGDTYSQGEEAGEENVTVDISGMPSHSHAFLGAAVNSSSASPADGSALANVFKPSVPLEPYYGPSTTPQPLNMGSISPAGGNLPHSNLQPYLTINWCIAMFGIFPSRN
jgi:microcystin-dependent protein